jgi:hypothetical protein
VKIKSKRVVFRCIGYFFSKIRYLRIKDPFKKFVLLKQKSAFSAKTIFDPIKKRPNILVLPIRVSPTSNLLEGLLGYALSLRGCNVSCLLDGGYLDISENNSIEGKNFISTALSVYEQNRFARAFEQRPIYFDSLIQPQEIELIKVQLMNLSLVELSSFRFKDISVGLHAKYGLMRYLKRETICEVHRDLMYDFVITAIKCVIATESAINNVKPDHALISHGCYSTWGTCLEVLNKHKVPAVVWGRGYVAGGSVIFSHDDSYLYEYIHEPNEYWNESSLTDAQIKRVLDYYKKKRIPQNSVDGISYYKSKPDERKLSALKERVASYDACIGIYPNIPWDGTMFSGTTNFPTIRHFLEKLHSYVIKNPKIIFITRCHPAEINNKGNETQESFLEIFDQVFTRKPKNIIVIPPQDSVSSYDVSALCNAAVMFGSTLSLELSIARHPVIQVGQTNTTNKGFIFDAPTEALFFQYLDQAARGSLELTDYQVNLAIKYAYHWIFKRHIPETLVELDGMKYKNFKFNNIKELLPNNNSVLDFICDAIISRKSFILPENFS